MESNHRTIFTDPTDGFRMEQLGIFLDKPVTSKYSPIFEVIHSFETLLMLVGAMLTVPLTWTVWNAKPLHRNLRILFAVSVMQCLAIFLTRPALIYAQYSDTAETSHILLSVAVIRIQSFAFFSIIMTGFTCERFIATFYWEWYEVQRSKTLTVIAGIFGGMILYIVFNTLQVIRVIRIDSIFAFREVGSPCAGFITFLSCIVYAVLLIYNKYQLSQRHQRAVSFYCLARTYQLRENVVMMEMILCIMGPAFLLCFPAFGFRALYHFLPQTEQFEFYRSLSVAMFDLWISTLTTIAVVLFPLFDFRFRNPAAKVIFYRQMVSYYNNRKQAREAVRKTDVEMADLYFASLNRDLNKPETPLSSKSSKYQKSDCKY